MRTALVGLFFVLVGTALAIFQGLRISRPIKLLAWRADQIARGDLETRVEISSGDEIGMLGENFNYMADRLLILHARDRREGDAREGARGRAHHPGDAGAAARSGRAPVRQARRLLPAGLAVRRRLVDGARLPDGRSPGRDRRRHRPRRAVGDDHRRGQGGVRRRARHRGRQAHRDAPARDHEPRDLRERQAQVRDDLLRVDHRPEARAPSRTPTPATTSRTCSGPAPATATSSGADVRGNRLGDLEESNYAEKTAALVGRRRARLVHGRHRRVRERARRGVRREALPRRGPPRRRARPGEMRESVVAAAGQFFGERPRKDDITMVFARIAS